jgi:rare lipoprotein A
VVLAGLVLGGCAATLPPLPDSEADSAPAVSAARLAQLRALPDPEPRSEPRSATGNPASYEQFGRTYRVLAKADGYDRVGNASWYGSKFHGRRTSSGEPFDMFELTAAHRTLPIPSYVEVTNLANGRQTLVRVNDRGPFHDSRILDLSFAAAVKLGFADRGTARVRVRVVTPESIAAPVQVAAAAPAELPPEAFYVPQPKYQNPGNAAVPSLGVAPRPASAVPASAAESPAPVADAASAGYFLQAGAFSIRAGAQRLLDQIVRAVPAQARITRPPASALYLVRIGPYDDPQAARAQQLALEREGFASLLLQAPGAVGDDQSCGLEC